ncbi:hypothetical protein D3C84_410480 [compost metagenome]
MIAETVLFPVQPSIFRFELRLPVDDEPALATATGKRWLVFFLIVRFPIKIQGEFVDSIAGHT